MPYLLRELRMVLQILSEKRRSFLLLTVGLVAASLLINSMVLSAVIGRLPSSFLLNDGSFALQADLDDPIDRYLEQVFPLYNYPLALIMFPREFVITNELGLIENVIASQPLFLTIHYFADFMPFALLIAAYFVLSRYHFWGLRTGGASKSNRKASVGGTLVSATSAATPSVGSGATTALTALAGGICCGAFAVESSIYVLGFALGAAGLVFISRVFLLVMAGFLVVGILRTSRKINTYCVVPRKEISKSM